MYNHQTCISSCTLAQLLNRKRGSEAGVEGWIRIEVNPRTPCFSKKVLHIYIHISVVAHIDSLIRTQFFIMYGTYMLPQAKHQFMGDQVIYTNEIN